MFKLSKIMLLDAQKRKYAVPAFNIHNLETLQVVVEAASELKSPVILAVTPSTLKYAGADYLLALEKVAAKRYNIPIVLHLDHAEELKDIKACIDLGYKSVMIDKSHEPLEKNMEVVSKVVDYASGKGVSVEAELGILGGKEDNINVDEKDAMLTDPETARCFVEETAIDSLAIAIGTAHGLYNSEPKLDFIRLKEIQSKVQLPLVLHGASGVSSEKVREAIKLGICKVNIATELKMPFAKAVRKYFEQNPQGDDPRKYLTPGKLSMKSVVIEKIKMCYSDGKAE